MNLIEQAARRLEELRRSGVEVHTLPLPGRPATSDGAGASAHDARSDLTPIRQRHARRGDASSQAPAVERVEIDLQRLTEMGYVTPDRPRTKIADEFRIVKRPLLNNIRGGKAAAPVERANLIMVTSALPGEGKTFVAINLAISMALEMDYSVALVDADVLRPAVIERLQLTPSPGLLDALTDPSIDIEQRLRPTNVEKLAVMAAGTAQSHASELLASDQMSELLDTLAARHPDRIVVIDAPPLLPTTEARVLATRVGQVVLVVESERTLRPAIEQAVAALESCPVVLPLLNKVNKSEVGAYHGYYEPIEK